MITAVYSDTVSQRRSRSPDSERVHPSHTAQQSLPRRAVTAPECALEPSPGLLENTRRLLSASVLFISSTLLSPSGRSRRATCS